MVCIYQLFENNQVISALKALRQYNITFVELNAIITAMPKVWKDFFKENGRMMFSPIPPTKYDWAVHANNLSSKIYHQIAVNTTILTTKVAKWNKNDKVKVTKDQLQSAFARIYTITNVPKLRSFNYRFLADCFNKASCLFCRNSIKCETSSVKRDCPLSEVLLPITIMDLIGN